MECTNALSNEGVQPGTPRARREGSERSLVRDQIIQGLLNYSRDFWGLPLHFSRVINHSSVLRTEEFPRIQDL